MKEIVVSLMCLGLSVIGVSSAAAQERPKAKPEQRAAAANPAAQFGPMIEAIRNTPGCLSVEVARLQSGKFAIFAFFKDKEAAKAWYDHPMHKEAMRRMLPDAVPAEDYEPMSEVPAGVPVLAAATITPPAPGKPGPAQISIELYTPLSGGLNIGGGFAPAGFAASDSPATQPSSR